MAIPRERLGQAIRIARDFANKTIASLHACKLQVGETSRERLPNLMWQLSIQDSLSIGLLMHMRYVGSARALVRPQFESLVRGAWMRAVATDEELVRFEAGTKNFPKISDACDELDRHEDGFTLLDKRVAFVKLRTKYIDAMHDHAHRGTRALAQRAHANQDGVYGVGDDEPAVLLLSTTFTRMAAAAFLENAGRDGIARDVNGDGIKAARSIVQLGLDKA